MGGGRVNDAYVIMLVNGWKIVTSDGSFLYNLHKGDPAVRVVTHGKTYTIPTTSIVCVQEADE